MGILIWSYPLLDSDQDPIISQDLKLVHTQISWVGSNG